MRTNKIAIFYKLTQKDIIGPGDDILARKDEWIKEIQRTVEAPWKPKIIEVRYRLFNPEVEQIRKFFNGAVVDYWIIQSQDLLEGPIPPETRRIARETLLSNVLGYDVKLIGRTERRRKSTSDFDTTQEWSDMLETLKETEFDPNGYFFPDSKQFWEITEKHGLAEAKRIAIEQLRYRIRKKTA